MFEQSQLEMFGSTRRKPASMIIGFSLQGILLGGALLFSLFFTEAAPRVRFDSSLIAPPRAKRNFIPIEQIPRQEVRVNFTPRPSGLYAPPNIPRHIVILDKPEAVEPTDPIPYGTGFLPGIDGNGNGLACPLVPGFEQSKFIEPPPPPPAKPVEHSSEPIRVGGEIASAKLIRRVQPIYPPLPRQTRIQGLVKLEAIISETGEIVNLRVINGHPLLIAAALDAVSRWRYRPTLLNGEAVSVITTIDVNFILESN